MRVAKYKLKLDNFLLYLIYSLLNGTATPDILIYIGLAQRWKDAVSTRSGMRKKPVVMTCVCGLLSGSGFDADKVKTVG